MISYPTDLKNRLFFTVQDVAESRGISIASARVLCNRYVQKGVFVRLKKNFYILDRNWERYGAWEFFKIANFLQVPSYISCMTALSFHGVTTQVQRNWYESIALKRSINREVNNVLFSYHKIRPDYYFGFHRREGFFVATPEKALLDSVYLNALGRYPLDWKSLDTKLLDMAQLNKFMEPFPPTVRSRMDRLCKN